MDLLTIVKNVSQQEGFEVKPLEEKYAKHYTQIKNTGHRCVDGRAVLEQYQDGSKTPWKNEDYLGAQLPGGTFGLISTLRVVAGIDEVRAREAVMSVCNSLDQKMGDHIDDEHGHTQSKQELDSRFKGCGNQDASGDGKIPMYAGFMTEELVKDRFEWLRENGGSVPALTGEHNEHLAAINLKPETTFNTPQAVESDESVFNADLPYVWNLAGEMYTQLVGSQMTQEEFQTKVVEAVVRDYAQTLVALGGQKEFYIRE